MAEDVQDFNRPTVGMIESVIKNYRLVLEHVKPNPETNRKKVTS